MATIAEQLIQLQNDKQVLVDNLVAKGVEASSDETFTTLAPKVANISSGSVEGYFEQGQLTSNNGSVSGYLKQIPMLDLSNKTAFTAFFSGCSLLKNIPPIDTSNATNTNSMFNNCSSLESVPQLDTSKVTNASSMFYNCSSLTSIPILDMSEVTSAPSMFYGCSKLETIEQLNCDKIINMGSMFQNCTALKAIPLFNTSNVTGWQRSFNALKALEELPQFDTSNLTSVQYACGGCNKLKTIPLLDFGKIVDDVVGFVAYCESLVDLGGFKDLGKSYTTTRSANYNGCTLSLSASVLLTHDSLMNVINNVYDIASIGVKTQKLELGATNTAKLTADEIAIATNKGWTVL